MRLSVLGQCKQCARPEYLLQWSQESDSVFLGESYLAEQFRQITHYLAEHLILTNHILYQ